MDGVLKLLLAILTAMSQTAVGSTDAVSPDRPAIAAPTVIPNGLDLVTSPDGSKLVVSGAIQSMSDGTLVVNDIAITLDSQTQINGQMQVGAWIQVRVIKRANDLEAQQVRVIYDSAEPSQSAVSNSRTGSSSVSSSRASSSETWTESSRASSSASSSEGSRSSSSASSSEDSRSSSSASSTESSRSTSSASSSEGSHSSASSSEGSHSSSSTSSKSSSSEDSHASSSASSSSDSH